MRYKPVKERFCPCGCGGLCTLNYNKDGIFKGYSHRAPHCPTSYANTHSPNPAKGRKREANGRWLPDGSTRLRADEHGFVYRLIKMNGEWFYEHRYVMEQFLGRPLLTNEHVHHKDEDTLHNTLDNLELLTASAHTIHHHTKKLKGWDLHPEGCLLCSTTTKKYCCKGLCITCVNRTYRAEHPDKIKQYGKTLHAKYRDKRNAKSKDYYHAHKEHKT